MTEMPYLDDFGATALSVHTSDIMDFSLEGLRKAVTTGIVF